MLNLFIGLAANSNLPEYKGPGPVSLFLYLLFFAVILLMAYFSTRFISKNYNEHFGKNMRVIEKLSIGMDKSLLIVQVGEEFYLVSNNKMGLGKARKLKNFVPIVPVKTELDFKNTFKNVLKQYRK